MQISLPLAVYKIWEINNLNRSSILVAPVSITQNVLGVSVKNYDNFPAFVSSLNREAPAKYREFLLSVPSLKISQAKVLVDSNDLASGLVHLPGSTLPGERGNVFISGHSALPLLKGAKSYQAIFANLSNLKKGDLIKVEVLGSEFSYQVMGLKVVDPDDLSVILPPDPQNRYISLMTCVPPGLNVKRLVVLGKLI